MWGAAGCCLCHSGLGKRAKVAQCAATTILLNSHSPLGRAVGGVRRLINGLVAEVVTNFDVVIECALLLGFSLHMLSGAVIIGWQLRSAEGRQVARTWLAVEESDPLEGLITMLAIPALGLLVILCSA